MKLKINSALLSLELEVDSIEIGGIKFTDGGMYSKGDLFIGVQGAGAGIIINDGNHPTEQGARIQAVNVTDGNTTLDLPNGFGILAKE